MMCQCWHRSRCPRASALWVLSVTRVHKLVRFESQCWNLIKVYPSISAFEATTMSEASATSWEDRSWSCELWIVSVIPHQCI